MSTDFFSNQDAARKQTARLVALFALAVVAIVASLYVLAMAVSGHLSPDPTVSRAVEMKWWNVEVLVNVVLVTLLIVGGGSLYKIAQLRGGGAVIAERLGGRLLQAETRDALERRILNVVEEMAIASGTPTPPVYLMEDERGINAFAAGFSPGDAVIGVTRGCAEQLSRDQLQGVIAHEFSHILNGDMRLNVRLMGIIHGILVIGIIGYFVLRSSMFAGHSRSRSGRDNGAPMLAIGIGLMVVGFMGTLFGNLIKASVSRQREFLADASAVQFTRNPGGIAGALAKIGGFEAGSAIDDPHAPEASHFFFGRAVASGISGLFSTHPPLEERIRRIDPSLLSGISEAQREGRETTTATAAAGIAGLTDSAVASSSSQNDIARDAIAQIGQPSLEHVAYATRLREGLPAAITAAAHEPWGARALVYALLIDREPAIRRVQLDDIARAEETGILEATDKLAAQLRALGPELRLPLLDMALPALRELSHNQYRAFRKQIQSLVSADRKMSLFEWTLQRALLRHLRPHFGTVRPARVKYRSMQRIAAPCSVVLSTLLHVEAQAGADAHRAYASCTARLGLPSQPLASEHCGLAILDEALTTLDQATPALKREILAACAEIIAADGSVSVAEAELFRAIADSLGCPVPPILPGQALAPGTAAV